MSYIEGHGGEPGCLFCSCLDQPDGPENLVLHRGARAFLILNRYPYTNGHLMVVPNAHRPSLEELDEPTLLELVQLTNRSTRLLRQVYSPQAFNIGINIGLPAGAGIADHVHIHVVPRWVGDTNFMSTIGETRVLPETLAQTYARLRAKWEETQTGT